MAEQRIGQLLDTLGLTAELDDGDMATDAVVILKVVQADGSVAISIGITESMDWITQQGLLSGALDLKSEGWKQRDS